MVGAVQCLVQYLPPQTRHSKAAPPGQRLEQRQGVGGSPVCVLDQQPGTGHHRPAVCSVQCTVCGVEAVCSVYGVRSTW